MAPQAYAQWSRCLDALAEGDKDEDCLHQLYEGQLEWTGGVAPMFAKRIGDEVQRRLGVCADRLTRDLKIGGHETLVVRAILQARGQLNFIHRLCHLPVLHEASRLHLSAEVRKFAERSQQSLEDSALADRSGQLVTLLRNNPLTRYLDVTMAQPTPDAAEPSRSAAVPSNSSAGSATGPRKRNILI